MRKEDKKKHDFFNDLGAILEYFRGIIRLDSELRNMDADEKEYLDESAEMLQAFARHQLEQLHSKKKVVKRKKRTKKVARKAKKEATK